MTITGNPKKKAVLLFDTEQSEQQLYKNVKKTIRRAYIETKPDFFHAYHMTAMSRKERLEAIRSPDFSVASPKFIFRLTEA